MREGEISSNKCACFFILRVTGPESEKPHMAAYVSPADFLDAVRALPECKIKDGCGRAAALIAARFNVSESTGYRRGAS
jgi:hypothetical protein